jgi:hypothetical protein
VSAQTRPGQIKPNEFELAILEHLARNEPSLRGSIAQLHVLSREFTGVGSFTTFACEKLTADAPRQQISLDDAIITMPGVPNGMGAVLFCKAGRPTCLEVYTYGNEHWEGVYDGFTIEQTRK